MNTVEDFAALLLEQRLARIRAEYPSQAEWERVTVKAGPVYTKVDAGPQHNMSGQYMVENATGIIFGIKGYGKVHKGHRYGTLDTIREWDWSGYKGRKFAEPADATCEEREYKCCELTPPPAEPTPAEYDAWYTAHRIAYHKANKKERTA